jgi:hypothetical protein
MFHEKATPMHFPFLTRQVPNSWHTSSGSFLTKGRSKVSLIFFSIFKQHRVSGDTRCCRVWQEKMTKPVYDLILGCRIMKELGIVVDFWTKEIAIDEVILPMRDINSLTTSKMKRAWTVNNSMAHEPYSMQEATQWVVHILDTKYEKADLQSAVSTNCTHLSLHAQNKLLLELLREFEELFDGTLGDWNTKLVSYELKEGTKPHHNWPISVPRYTKT